MKIVRGFAERLMRALEAGEGVGGDRRGNAPLPF